MRTRTSCPIAFVTLLLSCGVTFAGPPEIVKGQKQRQKAKLAAPWLDLGSGLKKSRKSRQPILLLYTATSRDTTSREPATVATDKVADVAEKFESYLRNNGFKRSLRDYVLVGLDPAELDEPFPPRVEPTAAVKKAGRRKRVPTREAVSPEPIGKKFVLHAEKSTLLVLSFREQVVSRYLDELPKRSGLRKNLTRIAKVNKVFAKEDRRVGAILEKSLYAFEAGKRKAAVGLVLPFTKRNSRLRMDDPLKLRVDGVIGQFRKVAATEMKKGNLLDEKKKYKEALDVFEAVLQDFAFPSIRKQAAIRKGEIWRKIQLFTRIPR